MVQFQLETRFSLENEDIARWTNRLRLKEM